MARDRHIQRVLAAQASATPSTLPSCKVALSQAKALNDSISQSATDETTASAKHVAELQKKYDDTLTILETLDTQLRTGRITEEQQKKLSGVQPGKALDLGVSIETQEQNAAKYIAKLQEHDGMAVDKYNALLADYKDYLNRVSVQLAQYGRQNQLTNALALYNLMPKYTPPQTINLNVTNCAVAPALCLH